MVARWLSGRWFWLLVGAAGLVVVMLMAGPVWAASDDSVTSPDTNGNVGMYASLVLDANGFPVVAYHDFTSLDLKVLHCDDPNCDGEGESITSPDTAGDVGAYASLVLDANGFPVVAYRDFTNQDLKLLHCDDPNCADNTAPVLVLPEDVVVEADGSGGAVVEYSVSAVDGDDPDPVVSCVPVSGSVFAVGDTVVTCTATDASGNESSGSFTVTVTYEEPEGFRFIDVAVGHLFDAEIHWLRDEGITFGCNPPDNTRYCPDDSVTRGQMAAFLVRAFDLPAASEDPFVDTQESVFVDDIARLAAAGVTRGCNPPVNDRYCPDDPVTRGEMAAFLYRALHLRP